MELQVRLRQQQPNHHCSTIMANSVINHGTKHSCVISMIKAHCPMPKTGTTTLASIPNGQIPFSPSAAALVRENAASAPKRHRIRLN